MSIDNHTEGESRAPQRAGDCVLPLSEVACSHLVTLHGPMVKAACHRILGDGALAEDAAQEVFLLLVRKLPSLPSQTILGGWLYVAACHLARTLRRTNSRRWQRENQPEVMENLMNPAQDTSGASWSHYSTMPCSPYRTGSASSCFPITFRITASGLPQVWWAAPKASPAANCRLRLRVCGNF